MVSLCCRRPRPSRRKPKKVASKCGQRLRRPSFKCSEIVGLLIRGGRDVFERKDFEEDIAVIRRLLRFLVFSGDVRWFCDLK